MVKLWNAFQKPPSREVLWTGNPGFWILIFFHLSFLFLSFIYVYLCAYIKYQAKNIYFFYKIEYENIDMFIPFVSENLPSSFLYIKITWDYWIVKFMSWSIRKSLIIRNSPSVNTVCDVLFARASKYHRRCDCQREILYFAE